MSQKKQPNIILITTDQQRFDTIQCLGNETIFTPHLNWLVDEGRTFTRCYADCPVCIPSRTTIMTGIKGYRSGIVANQNHSKVMTDNPTIPGVLTSRGYQTRAIGKMHFEPARSHFGFEHMELTLDYYREMARKGVMAQPKEHGVGENEVDPVISTVDDQDSLTHWTVDRSIDFIETRDETRPFFLWTSFAKPHPPFDPCLKYWMLYTNDDMPDPIIGDWSSDPEDRPHGFYRLTYMINNIQRYSPRQIKAIRRAYYACITQIDYSLGRLFARLRELDLLDNTWIIFTSDHGDMLGDHHMGAKFNYFEGAAHVPMVIRPPYQPFGELNDVMGSRCDTLVELADIFPTVMAIAGIEQEGTMEGRDLMSVENGDEDRIFYGNCGNQIFAVIDKNIKYTYAVKGGEELMFDLNEDPYETHNLINQIDHKPLHEKMRSLMEDKIKTNSPHLMVEGAMPKEERLKGTQDVCKWPGFHSKKVENLDVLH